MARTALVIAAMLAVLGGGVVAYIMEVGNELRRKEQILLDMLSRDRQAD